MIRMAKKKTIVIVMIETLTVSSESSFISSSSSSSSSIVFANLRQAWYLNTSDDLYLKGQELDSLHLSFQFGCILCPRWLNSGQLLPIMSFSSPHNSNVSFLQWFRRQWYFKVDFIDWQFHISACFFHSSNVAGQDDVFVTPTICDASPVTSG